MSFPYLIDGHILTVLDTFVVAGDSPSGAGFAVELSVDKDANVFGKVVLTIDVTSSDEDIEEFIWFRIDWGDMSTPESGSNSLTHHHVYSKVGTYTIIVTATYGSEEVESEETITISATSISSGDVFVRGKTLVVIPSSPYKTKGANV